MTYAVFDKWEREENKSLRDVKVSLLFIGDTLNDAIAFCHDDTESSISEEDLVIVDENSREYSHNGELLTKRFCVYDGDGFRFLSVSAMYYFSADTMTEVAEFLNTFEFEGFPFITIVDRDLEEELSVKPEEMESSNKQINNVQSIIN